MPGGPDDIIYSAEVEDNTGEFFDEFDSRVDQMEQHTNQAFSNMEGGGTKAAAIMGLVGGAVGGITMKLVEMAFAGAQAFVSFIQDSAMLAARVETLGVALEVAGAHAGYTADELTEFEEHVKSMGITTSKARIALTQMAQADLELAQAADLARVAQDAAVVAGVNSSEAFNRILYAITSLQPEILRTMNLTVNMSAELERYSARQGKTVGQISETERKQVMLNAVMKAGADIAGTYEASLDTVGKMLTSLPRYFEEIQLALGNAFQPAMLVGVTYLTDKLKSILHWLEENEEAMANFGVGLADLATWLTTTLDSVGTFLASIPEAIKSFGFEIAKTIATATESVSPEEMDSRREKLGEYFKTALALLAYYAVKSAYLVLEAFRLLDAAAKPLAALLSGEFAKASELWAASIEVYKAGVDEANAAADRAIISVSEFLGLIEKTGDAAEDTGDKLKGMATDTAALEDALELAASRIEDFARNMEQAIADLAIQIARRATEAALRESWAREDMERKHQRRILSIMEQAAASRRAIARRYTNQRISIEKDYQRRVRDLQRRFEFQAGELARARDAVGLLRLMRGHKEALDDAERTRKDRLEDAKAAFAEEMKLMEERIAEQLRMAERAHQLQLEDFERMKMREREIQALHDKWAEEDRQTQYARQLAELIIQLQSIEGITHEGLEDLLGQWNTYFGHLLTMAQAYMEALGRMIKPGGTYTPPGDEPPKPHGYPPGAGQGGRVSQMMSWGDYAAGADVQRYRQFAAPPPIPIVPTSDMRRERKEITVSVSGEGLSPYIQRVVANALLEIERNASGG